MHSVSIVLNIAADLAEEFEGAFAEHEVPIWNDLHARGKLKRASISPLEISTKPVAGARQYLILAQFDREEDHETHDDDPRFKAWNEMADRYQPEQPFVFGGNALFKVGD